MAGIEPDAEPCPRNVEGETAALLRNVLRWRLTADGHHRLAEAMVQRFLAHAPAEPSRPKAPAGAGLALLEEMGVRPLAADEMEHRTALADGHSAKVLLDAPRRLRADHREALAG